MSEINEHEQFILTMLTKLMHSINPVTDISKDVHKTFVATMIRYYKKVLELTVGDPQYERRKKINQAVELILEDSRNIRAIISHLDKPPPDIDSENGLEELINIAKQTLNIPENIDVTTIPIIGTQFFTIRPRINSDQVILSIPLVALVDEIELKSIWHEMASLVVNPDNKPLSPKQRDGDRYSPNVLMPLLNATKCEAIDIEEWKSKSNELAQDAQDVLAKYDSDEESGGWNIFWMINADRINRRWQKLEDYALPESNEKLVEDWRIAHLHEFAEDACMTLSFGEESYFALVDALSLYYDKWDDADLRHPSPYLRLEVTYRLLKILNSDFNPDSDRDPLAGMHGHFLGTKEIAEWLHGNKELLVPKPFDNDTNRRIVLEKRNDLIKGLNDTLKDFVKSQQQDASELLALYEDPKLIPTDIKQAIAKATDINDLDIAVFSQIDPREYYERVTRVVRSAIFNLYTWITNQ